MNAARRKHRVLQPVSFPREKQSYLDTRRRPRRDLRESLPDADLALRVPFHPAVRLTRTGSRCSARSMCVPHVPDN
jgi:hypothetical protein